MKLETYQANWTWTEHTETWLQVFNGGKSILNFPCGMSKIGFRVDVDRKVKPDLIADLYHPPFVNGAFDVVICDPPFNYYGKGFKWFWKRLADVAKEKLILSTPLRNIKGIKGRKTVFLMCDSPNYMRMFQIFTFYRLTKHTEKIVKPQQTQILIPEFTFSSQKSEMKQE